MVPGTCPSERDSLGRVSAVRTQDNELAAVVTLASSFSYLPFGPLSGLQFGNGLALALGHDQDYRLTGIVTSDGASNQVQHLALGYDANDHASTIIDGLNPGRSQAFAYDELWRLEQAAGAYGTIDYAYDAAGNRLARSITAGGTTVETYGYDAFSHRLLSVAAGGTTRSFGYAADGSVVSDDRGADVFGFAYDAAGRLAAVDKNSAPEAAYAYDAFGLRVLKDLTIGGTTHANYGPDGRLLAESAATGVAEREYIWLPLDFAGGGEQAWALPLAVVTDAGTAGPRIHYLHTDQLGTPVAMTSGGLGQLEWSAVLRPFGEVESITGTELLALRLPGQVFDPETGFHQNWHRDYDPRLARYLQSDPIGLTGGLSTYAYVRNNPIRWTDALGLEVLLCHRPADLPFPLNQFDHYWIKTDTLEAGMGGMGGGVPGQAGNSDWPYDPTQTVDHTGQSLAPNSSCEVQRNVDEQCVNNLIVPGQPTGPWNPYNQCQSFAYSVIGRCRTGPQIGPTH